MQPFRLGATPLIEGEQGLVFERKHGKAAHEGVRQRNFGIAGTMVGHPGKVLADSGEHGVGVEVCAHFEVAESLDGVAVAIDTGFDSRHGGFSPCK